MAEHTKLHVALLPWLAFGHLIPNLELAKLIAQKGHRVSFISTPRNIQRLPKVPQSLSNLIDFVKVSLPHVENLPQNAESTMDVPNHQIRFLMRAMDGMKDDVARFLETSCPDWIIYDFTPNWIPTIAANLGIKCAFFCSFNAASISFYGSAIPEKNRHGANLSIDPKSLTVPPKCVPFPTNLALKHYEAKKLVSLMELGNQEKFSDSNSFMIAVSKCEVIFIRSCVELESQWLSLFEDHHRKQVVPVGLLPPVIEDSREDDKESARENIASWLDKQEKAAVVFVALGSEVNPSREEFTELALGLELSGLPFFWALRNKSNSLELPEGYEDRVRDRGMICTDWAPQLKVLSHESVGGFLTHCGWSSAIEGMYAGLPLIMLPLWGDQWLNARVLEEKKVGIEIPRNEEDGWFTRDSVAESLRMVMVEKEGKIYREKAEEMSKLFGDKELHNRYVDKFVDYLQSHKK